MKYIFIDKNEDNSTLYSITIILDYLYLCNSIAIQNYNIYLQSLPLQSNMTMRGLKQPPKCPHLEVNISTWIKDSHGLYDYEATEDSYKKETVYIKNSCRVFRDPKGQTYFDDKNKLNQNIGNILVAEIQIDKSKNNPQHKVRYTQKKFIEPNMQHLHQMRTPYLSVRQFSRNGVDFGYPLKPGNVIKLGRVEYMVIESKNEHQTFTLRDTNHFEQTNGVFQIAKHIEDRDKAIQEGQNNCKVCLCNQQLDVDPLISPCNCKGSCRLIHVGCLRTWINSKVKKQLKGIAASYNFTKFQCEICKFPFPQIIRFTNKDVEMMTIAKPNKPYILLESLCNKFQNKEQRCLHLISTEQNTPIKLGRGHQCQIRITDISVSRKHAQITLKEGQFYISDTKAKFGTLIKFQQEFNLASNRSIKVQCGRTVYEFKNKSEPQQEVETENDDKN